MSDTPAPISDERIAQIESNVKALWTALQVLGAGVAGAIAAAEQVLENAPTVAAPK